MYNFGSLLTQSVAVVKPSPFVPGLCTILALFSLSVSRSTLSVCSWSMYNLGSLASQCWSVVLPSVCVPGLCTISILSSLSVRESFYPLRCVPVLCTILALLSLSVGQSFYPLRVFMVYVQSRLSCLSVLVSRSTLSVCSCSMYNLGSLVSQC